MREPHARRRAGAALPALIAALWLAAAGCSSGQARPARHPSPRVTPMVGGPAGRPQPVLGGGHGTDLTGLQAGPQRPGTRAGARPSRSTGPAGSR
jgi:hypothetical protein